ncbi:MAG: STAS domain-containing protein [Candidatus Abyssobacteria bacterium SURF_17]|uniref:STAS domain-containing protein n=1 Tax=Candidatus Abyssobacteria bacterium SURF_17 TaxID=2093361 RepID=A0A419EW61_9BACT|nr:MAG: STAS domain-containing protein [Candidatus Abyssubacteria bacterium SURF_17]
MAKEGKKSSGGKAEHIVYAVNGTFDSKTATEAQGKLGSQLGDASISSAILDFSAATHITAGGIAGFMQLVGQLQAEGKPIVVRGMRSELYKALKVAGLPDSITFSHQTVG